MSSSRNPICLGEAQIIMESSFSDATSTFSSSSLLVTHGFTLLEGLLDRFIQLDAVHSTGELRCWEE